MVTWVTQNVASNEAVAQFPMSVGDETFIRSQTTEERSRNISTIPGSLYVEYAQMHLHIVSTLDILRCCA